MNLILRQLMLFACLLNFLPAQASTHAFDTLKVHAQTPAPLHDFTYFKQVAKDTTLSIDQVRALSLSDWQAPINSVLNFGYSDDTYWFRISMEAEDEQSTGTYFFKIDYPVLDIVGLYVEQGGEIIEQHLTGDSFPFHQRPFESQAFVLPVSLTTQEKVLYIQLKSQGTLQLPASLLSEKDYHASTMAFYISQGIYFGVVGIMMFYNLILFFAFRAREYLYYVLYAGMMMLVLSTMHGFNYQYLWPNSPWWNSKAIPFAISMSSLTLLLFTYHFLNVRNYSRTLPMTIRGFTIALAIIAGLAFVLPYGMAIKLSAATSVATILLCVFTSFKALKMKEPAAKHYILAWCAMLFGALCFLLAMFGLLPSNAFTQNTMQIGLGLEAIILSFALAEKIRQVRKHSENDRKKRFQMQQVALEKEKELRQEKEKAFQTQRSLAEALEHQVEQRTQELQSALSELSNANILLQEMCTIDGLTQMHNRRFFDDKLADEWKRSSRENTPLSLILLDIDHFKSFNDNYGHLVGDECLKFVAQRIEQHCRRPADCAARYGGEEFILILPNTPMEGALNVAEAIRHSVQKEDFVMEDIQAKVTISVGVSTFQLSDYQSLLPADLVQAADKAMYKAKQNGRNTVESAPSH